MSSWFEDLKSQIKTPARRLLAVGLSAVQCQDLDAKHYTRMESLPESCSASFDWIVWRSDNACTEDECRRISSWLEERARLLLVTPRAHRVSSLFALSTTGFAVHKEIESHSKSLVLARSTDFVVRSFEPGDEHDILQMFKPSFHVERSEDHWRWKFERQPYGTRQITIARSNDGTLAAHYAGYPVPFEYFPIDERGRLSKPESLTGLQIGDTMTLPKYRSVGRGPTSLLGRCVRHFFAAHCEDKVAFNYGFNTGNIQKFSKLFVRAESVGKVGYWTRPQGMPPESSRRYRISQVQDTDRSWDRFFQRVAGHYRLLVRRDARWIRWRYLECPDTPPFVILEAKRWGRLVAWSVFRRHGSKLRWCDALFDPKHVEASWSLLRRAFELPQMEGVDEVEAWFPSRPEWWRRQLVALGFEPGVQPDDLAVMTVPFQKDSPVLLKDLYYTMGDSDLA